MAINNVAVPCSLLLSLLLVLESFVCGTPKEQAPETSPALPNEALNAMVMRHLRQFHQVGKDHDTMSMWKKGLWPPTANEDYENLLSDEEANYSPMALAQLARHNMESLVPGTGWDTLLEGGDGANYDDTSSKSSRAPSFIFHPSVLLNPMHSDQED